MKKAMIVFIALLSIGSAGSCKTITVTTGGTVHTVLVCD